MRALTMFSLLTSAVLFTSCGGSGPPNCQALETCCGQMQGDAATMCRAGLDQTLQSGATESEIDAVCGGALDVHLAASSCTAESPSEPNTSGLELKVVGVGYLPGSSFPSDRALFLVAMSLKNAEGQANASLSPALFTLRLSGGAGVVGQLSIEFSQGACAPDLVVLASGEVGCTLQFAIPMGSVPSALVYGSPDGRSATAPIPTCSASFPEAGLCPETQVCEMGICKRHGDPSGPTVPEGCFELSVLSSECLSCALEANCVTLNPECSEVCNQCWNEPSVEARCSCQQANCGNCLDPVRQCFAAQCPADCG